MFADTHAMLAPALVQRLVLLINHVLSSETQATQRLLPHQGRVLRMELIDWPGLLPTPPNLSFRITPAGLLEWAPEATSADLNVRVPAANPLALAASFLTGTRAKSSATGPSTELALDIEGDARLASDVDWLSKNLRWDLAADLERLFGPIVAHQLATWGAALSRGLARLARVVGGRVAAPGPAPTAANWAERVDEAERLRPR